MYERAACLLHSLKPSENFNRLAACRTFSKEFVTMFSVKLKFVPVLILVVLLPFFVAGQSGRNKQKQSDTKKTQKPAEQNTTQQKTTLEQNNEPQTTQPDNQTVNEKSDDDIVKVDTNLVLVPVIVSDRNDIYIADLKQEEFEIYEDNEKQIISFFGATTQPFHVVLMLDTSASAEAKLSMIRQAAFAFVTQLQDSDRVKVISFDDQVLTLSEFTNDRQELRNAIYRTRPGRGTKLYDAMDTAISSFAKIQGRKAIVIFTDGVDWHSDYTNSSKNLQRLEESGIIVYPIRYDTREEVEQLARQQQAGGQTIDLNVIFGTGVPIGQTPTTFPGGTGGGTTTHPPSTTRPIPPITINKRRTTYPPTNDPNNRTGQPTRDTVGEMLDRAYSEADAYLNELAKVSGGKLHRADTLGNLPDAFDKIASELRTQYAIGYYPANKTRDGKFRKVKVKTTRKNAVVRAKPGYRVPKEG